jgi:putative sugar O-methyltransferase
VDLSTLFFDERLFNLIVDDLRNNSNQHRPADVWLEAGGGADDPAAVGQFASENLIAPWVGFGASEITPESLYWYYQYLADIDAIGLMESYFESESRWKPAAHALSVADLGTILDVNLICPFIREPAREQLHIIEVGGGYGRLAEAFLNLFEGKVKYLLVDAVPSSLMYAREYLSRCNPDWRIGFSYDNDPLDWERFDCYIAPIWALGELGVGDFDVAVNVQGMQEMDQHHVDFYLNWFDAVLREEGIIYLCNRRDHVFRGEWRFPNHWECLLKTITPRSWTRDFPAEVYRKGVGTFASENNLREVMYRHERDYMRQGVRTEGERRQYRVY